MMGRLNKGQRSKTGSSILLQIHLIIQHGRGPRCLATYRKKFCICIVTVATQWPHDIAIESALAVEKQTDCKLSNNCDTNTSPALAPGSTTQTLGKNIPFLVPYTMFLLSTNHLSFFPQCRWD